MLLGMDTIKSDTLRPLFSACKSCKVDPAIHTRQRAMGARPAGKWYQACEQHVPGVALKNLPPDHPVVLMAARLQAHEVVWLNA